MKKSVMLMFAMVGVCVSCGMLFAKEGGREGPKDNVATVKFVRLVEQKAGEREYLGLEVQSLEGQDKATLLIPMRRAEDGKWVPNADLAAMARSLRTGQTVTVSYVIEEGFKWLRRIEGQRAKEGEGAAKERERAREGEGAAKERERAKEGERRREGEGAAKERERAKEGEGAVRERERDREGEGAVRERERDREGEGATKERERVKEGERRREGEGPGREDLRAANAELRELLRDARERLERLEKQIQELREQVQALKK